MMPGATIVESCSAQAQKTTVLSHQYPVHKDRTKELVHLSFPTVTELIPVLQVAIGPVILISGVGLLLLSMTNRLGRVIDRARILDRELRPGSPEDPHRNREQLRILIDRARLLRLAIVLASVSVLSWMPDLLDHRIHSRHQSVARGHETGSLRFTVTRRTSQPARHNPASRVSASPN